MKIKVAIFGYGNLGKGVEEAVLNQEDMELVAVFSRRDNLETIYGKKIININNISEYKNKIDVLILCGGSKNDLPDQTPKLVEDFTVVDSFDTHADIPAHFDKVNKIAKKNSKVAIISAGWDPGLFSIVRCMFESFLTKGHTYTFWGKGVSQGHSDAIRTIKGVKKAVQYTVPIENAIKSVRDGKNPDLSIREKHRRVCFVVAEKKDQDRIKKEIITMKNYFDQYDTEVNFISEEEFDKYHTSIPHGGFVFRSGSTNNDKLKYLLELSIKLESNPGFTGSILTSYARAAYRMYLSKAYGCYTVLDIPIGMLSPMSRNDIRKTTV